MSASPNPEIKPEDRADLFQTAGRVTVSGQTSISGASPIRIDVLWVCTSGKHSNMQSLGISEFVGQTGKA